MNALTGLPSGAAGNGVSSFASSRRPSFGMALNPEQMGLLEAILHHPKLYAVPLPVRLDEVALDSRLMIRAATGERVHLTGLANNQDTTRPSFMGANPSVMQRQWAWKPRPASDSVYNVQFESIGPHRKDFIMRSDHLAKAISPAVPLESHLKQLDSLLSKINVMA